MDKPFLSAFAAFAVISTLTACSGTDDATAPEGEETVEARSPTGKLDIRTAKAEPADSLPLATVPGQIALPPEARMAVTSPFPGAAVQVYVIEGEAVRRGQPLALVRAAEPVRFHGDLTRSEAELDMAKARAQRLEQLASEGIIAKARAEEAQAGLQQARASVLESRRLLALAGARADGTMTLRSPISGRVAHVGVDAGGPVDGMTAPFVIENTGAYRIDLQLPERLALSVQPGMAVEVQLPRLGGEPLLAAGNILSVAPSIDPATRSVMAKASVANTLGLVAGQNVMVTISGVNMAKGVSIPSSAITRMNGSDHVFVRDGKNFSVRKVTVAAEAGGRSVISGGLNAGEEVATSSITELKAMAAE